MPTLRERTPKTEIKTDKDITFTLLGQIEKNDLQEKLTKMIEDITAQGKKIAEHMDIRDIKQYRTMISEFFTEVVANSHEFSRENYLDKRGRHRVYGIIRQVDVKLDELAKELMSSQKSQVRILDKLGEIEGLILDINT